MPANYQFLDGSTGNAANLDVSICRDGSSVFISINEVAADSNPVTAAANGSFNATFSAVPIDLCSDTVALTAAGVVTAPNTYSVNVTSGDIADICLGGFEALQIDTTLTVVLDGVSGCEA